MDIYQKLDELGITIPSVPPKGGIYKPALQVGNLLYVSGQGPTKNGVPIVVGKVGAETSIEEAKQAAHLCALNALAVVNDYLGDLNKIEKVVKILAFVSSAPSFNMQPKVVDGASALYMNLWGEEKGIGVRSAIGVNELPGNISVEIEFIFEIKT